MKQNGFWKNIKERKKKVILFIQINYTYTNEVREYDIWSVLVIFQQSPMIGYKYKYRKRINTFIENMRKICENHPFLQV